MSDGFDAWVASLDQESMIIADGNDSITPSAADLLQATTTTTTTSTTTNNNNGSVAELAASKKMDKYTCLAADYHFQPIAVKMLGLVISRLLIFLVFCCTKLANVRTESTNEQQFFSRPV